MLAWAFAPRPLEVQTAAASNGRFETTIDEDGKTRLRGRCVVSAPLAGGRAHLPPVHIGARNQAEAWVRHGSATGARVIVYPPAGVADGVRFQERHV